jgi:hypothetical protein
VLNIIFLIKLKRDDIMKKIFITIVLSLFFAGIASAADFNRYNGTWGNYGSGTLTVTKMEISVVDSKVHVHTWGPLQPKKDYDWGWTPASTHADGHLSLRYKTSKWTRNLTVNLNSRGHLVVNTKTHYTDGSGKPDSEVRETLRRNLTPATQTPKPVDRISPRPAEKVNPKPYSSSAPTGKY